MNLFRRVAGILHLTTISSHATRNKWLLASLKLHQSPYATWKQEQQQFDHQNPSSSDTDSEKPRVSGSGRYKCKEFPNRPGDIQWQEEIDNAVHLIGRVAMPVQLRTLPDGKKWALSTLVKEKIRNLPHLWIPIIFEGDLACTVACHMRENDLIYVSGQLSADLPRFSVENSQATVQDPVATMNGGSEARREETQGRSR